MTDQVVAVKTEDQVVAENAKKAAEAQAHRTPAEVKALAAAAEVQNNRDPVEEEKRNNARSLARSQVGNAVLNNVADTLAGVRVKLEQKKKEVEAKQKEVAALHADIKTLHEAEHVLTTKGEVLNDPLIKEIQPKVVEHA